MCRFQTGRNGPALGSQWDPTDSALLARLDRPPDPAPLAAGGSESSLSGGNVGAAAMAACLAAPQR